MITSNINISSRPLKIVFFVKYNDKEAMKNVITINSVLWGGRYNPVIPVYDRLPARLKPDYRTNLRAVDVTSGYVDAFDADFAVNMTNKPNSKLTNKFRFIKETDLIDLTKSLGDKPESKYGVNALDILDHCVEQEFKYTRSIPFDVNNLTFGKKYELFLGNVFGLLPERWQKHILLRYSESIGIKSKKIQLSDYYDVYKDLRASTVNGVINSCFTVYPGDNSPDNAIVFLMDANSWQDNVDFVDLRATGKKILPISIQSCEENKAKELTEVFIKRNFKKYNDNGVFCSTTILKSRDCPQEMLDTFVDRLTVHNSSDRMLYSVQPWFPRFWENYGETFDGTSLAKLENNQTSHTIDGTNDVNIRSLRPSIFGDRQLCYFKPRYANDIKTRSYDFDAFSASIFPDGIKYPHIILKAASYEDWRFSKGRIVFTPHFDRDYIQFRIPDADTVYTAWQEQSGIETKTSLPGKLVEQIIKKIGTHNLDLLAVEGIVKLLQGLTNAKGKLQTISYDKLRSELNKFIDKSNYHNVDNILNWMLDKGMLSLGIEIKCDKCEVRHWYAFEGLNNEIHCQTCLELIHIDRFGNPKDQLGWAYRPSGPFAIPDLAKGSYTVVLVLRFLTDILHKEITPRYSFESIDHKYEADFGVLIAGGWQDGDSVIQLIGECKSFGEAKLKSQFSKKEVLKLLALADKGCKSTIVFATLNKELKPADKKMLAKSLEQIRNAGLSRDNLPNLLVLTGNELFAQRSLSDSWKVASNAHKKFADRANFLSISELVNYTQQIYLGADDWHTWWIKKNQEKQSAAAINEALSPGQNSHRTRSKTNTTSPHSKSDQKP